MLVDTLSLTNFRNFSQLSTDLAPGINIFYGDNGSGKTNLLEAIYTVCLGRSQRGAVDATMIRDGVDVYRVVSRVENGGSQPVEVAVAFGRNERKKITLDGAVIPISRLYGLFCAVSSGPEDSTILSGGPSERRLFLNLHLAQHSVTYLADLGDYQRTLSQKNAALKNGMDPSPFDPLLIEYGIRIMRARARFIDALRETARPFYQQIARGESMDLTYLPSVAVGADAWDDNGVSREFEARLAQNREKERILKNASVGPHRDDIGFTIGGLPARTHGSQGQWRTAAIALKLGIYHILKEKRRTTPVLLLDEIFAELDEGRALGLVQEFAEVSQVFLTTAVEPPQSLKSRSRSYRVVKGAIESVD